MAAETPTKEGESSEKKEPVYITDKSNLKEQDKESVKSDGRSTASKGGGQSSVNNPTTDSRNMRRIIAEDQEWSLATVPLLVDICINHIVSNFENNSEIINKLSPKHQAKVLEKLPVSLPLKVTALLIQNEGYWKRCCQNRWKVCNVDNYGGSWKRMYFERNLEHIIEYFVPDKTDPIELTETLELSSDFVIKLDVGQFLPPVNETTKGLEYLDSGSDVASDVEHEYDHFNIEPVLKKLIKLQELHLTYSVRDCGMNFEWNMFHFTQKDCQRLCEAVKDCHSIKILHLHRSKLDDEKVRVLVSHLLEHPNLEELNLSHNTIGDRGAKVICKLITSHDQIKKLNLCNNVIRVVGGQALAHALVKTKVLKTLNLRLNRIGDEGGLNLCKALTRNSSLEELNIAANEMGEVTAAALAQVLLNNTILVRIDFSCNLIGMEGGKQLLDGMAENNVVTELDLRLTECGQEVEFGINQILDRNQERKRENNLRVENENKNQHEDRDKFITSVSFGANDHMITGI